MKIDSRTPLVHPSSLDTSRESRSIDGGAPASQPNAGPSSMTHLSSISDSSQDVDMQRVAEIRDAIREGRIEINPERIADGLIASLHDASGRE